MDSVSLWPLLLGDGESVRESMLTELFGGQGAENRDEGHAIRNADHKLICYLDGGADLFDLASDRWESTDLYDGAPAKGWDVVYADLSAELETWTGLDVCP